ncbi:MAG: hypothetical protein K0U64_02285 [Actinomycetia bacterium]|nr:hypothetical protein [Actinomycetes bacterium]
METTSASVMDFIVIGGCVVLLILAGVQLADIWVHRTPLFRWQDLYSGAKARWLAAMIILGIGLIPSTKLYARVAGLRELNMSAAAPDGEALELANALYGLGGFSFLLLAFLTAWWRPVRAALVVAVAAVSLPVLALIPFSFASDPDFGVEAGFTVIIYSAPALLVAFLLWSSQRVPRSQDTAPAQPSSAGNSQ